MALDENSLPKLNMPVGIGSGLPNKLIFYHVSKDDIFAPKQLINADKNREDVVSDNLKENEGQYIRFTFDNNGIINGVVYLGYEDINMAALVSFVGLSENYLNQLGIRLKSGLIPNVTEFLSENWAMALYHEWFSEFRYIIKSDLMANEDMMNVMKEVQEMAKNGAFLT